MILKLMTSKKIENNQHQNLNLDLTDQKQEQVLLYKTVGNAVSQGPEVFLGQSPTVLSSLQSSQQPQIGNVLQQ